VVLQGVGYLMMSTLYATKPSDMRVQTPNIHTGILRDLDLAELRCGTYSMTRWSFVEMGIIF